MYNLGAPTYFFFSSCALTFCFAILKQGGVDVNDGHPETNSNNPTGQNGEEVRTIYYNNQ